jgi:hypothetical protein
MAGPRRYCDLKEFVHGDAKIGYIVIEIVHQKLEDFNETFREYSLYTEVFINEKRFDLDN